ncbi:VOC family protein [Cohnella soli]|uniref:VOC family protein n=1 Tax=Cohnella soli TaxID=425005 RepID=A0ABW0HXR8_9BACL
MGIKLDMVGIVVKDMKAALDFYRTLGLDIPEQANGEAHVEVAQSGFRLAFDKQEMIKGVYGGWVEPVGHRIEIAFLCDSSDEVNKVYQTVIEAGYQGHNEPWDAFWGQRYAIVQDPDGNLISLFASLE